MVTKIGVWAEVHQKEIMVANEGRTIENISGGWNSIALGNTALQKVFGGISGV
jgi:hypothetical protein